MPRYSKCAVPQHPVIGGIGPAQPKFVPAMAQDVGFLPIVEPPEAPALRLHAQARAVNSIFEAGGLFLGAASATVFFRSKNADYVVAVGPKGHVRTIERGKLTAAEWHRGAYPELYTAFRYDCALCAGAGCVHGSKGCPR